MTLFLYALRDALKADSGVTGIVQQRVWLRDEIGPANINISNIKDIDSDTMDDAGQLKPFISISRSVGGPNPESRIHGYRGHYLINYFVGQFVADGLFVLEQMREAVRQAVHYREFNQISFARGGTVFFTFAADGIDYDNPMLNHALTCFDRYEAFYLRNRLPNR